MLHLIFIIELLLLGVIIYKYSIINPITLGYIIFFIYGQSFYIDNLFFDLEYLSLYGFNNIYIHDTKYIYVSLMYFIFFLGYSITPIVCSNYKYKYQYVLYPKNIIKNNIILYISIFILGWYLYTTKDFSRELKTEWLQSHKIITFSLNIIGYIWIISFLKKKNSNKSSYLIYFMTILFILFALYDGGRELFIYIILCILFMKFERFNSLVLIIVGMVLLFILTIWKAFFVYIIMNGFDYEKFIHWFELRYYFSLSNSDPKSSLFLIYSYFNESNEVFYSKFGLTYIENVLGQILRAFKLIEYPSLGEQVAMYFQGVSQKGKGIAFSGILESILNFWYFGPFFFGLFLGYITKKVNDIKYFDQYKYNILSLFIIIIMFKLVRTEVAVVLKIYIVPMAIAYFLIFKNSYIYKSN